MSKPTILCVDDERNVLLTLRTQLLRYFPECIVEIAESAAEALELVDELRAEGVEIPLVIADQIMPGMKGDELLIALHAHHPQILTIMLTGQSGAEAVGNVVNRGNLYRFMAKPWDEVDLTLTVTEALRRYQQERQIAQQQTALEQANQKLAALNANLEQQVQERTEQLRLFVEHTPAAVAMFDRDMRYLLTSRRWKEDYRLGDQDLIGRCHYDVFPTVPDRWKAVHQRCLAGAVERCEEDFFIREDGSVTWNQWEVRPWYSESQGIGGLILFDQVITERKQAEIALRESEQRYATLAETAPVGIFRNDAEGNLIYANDRWWEITGLNRAAGMGQAWMNCVHPDWREELERKWEQILQPGSHHAVEICLQMLDGSLKWVYCQAQPEKDSTGQVTGYVGTLTDITQQKQLDLTLRQSEAELHSLFAVVDDVIFVLDRTGNYLKILGDNLDKLYLPPDQLLGHNCRDFFPPDLVATFLNTITATLNTQQTQECEYSLLINDTEVWFNARCSFVTEETVLWVARDISDRKLTELALSQSQASLVAAQRIARVGNWEFELASQKVTWSEELFHLYGRDSSCWQPTYDEFRQQVPAEDWLAFEQVIQQAITEGVPYTMEHRVICPDGTLRYAVSKGEAVRNAQGQVIKLIGTTQDITASRQTEAALRASERRYAALAEASPVGIFRFDAAGDCVYVNSAWCRMTGRSVEAAFGKTWVQTLHPEDRERILAEWGQAFEQGGVYRSEGRYLRPDGSIIWFYCQVLPETDAQGLITGYVGTVTDITDRKQAELELLENQAFIQRITTTSAGTIYVYDVQEQRNLYTNRDFLSLLGYSTAEIQRMGSDWLLDLLHPEDLEPVFQHQARIKAAEDGETVMLEYRVRRRDGEWFWAQSFDTPFKRDANGEVQQYLGTVFDITDRKQAEQAVLESERYHRDLLEQLVTGLLICRMDGTFTYANPALAEIFGYSVEETLALSYWDITPADYAEQEALQLESLRTTGRYGPYEKEYIHRDGHRVPVRLSGVLIERNGESFIWSSVENITDRKQAEAALRDALEFNQQVIASAQEGVIVWDADLCYRVWNPYMAKLSGIPAEAVLGQHPLALFPFLEENGTYDLMERALAGETVTVSEVPFQVSTTQKSGWTSEAFSPLYDAQNNIVGVIGIVSDITERRQAEAELRQSEERLRLAQQASQTGSWDWNLIADQVSWSEEYYQIFGLDPAVVPSYESWLQSILPDDRQQVEQQIRICLEQQTDLNLEYRTRHPQRGIRWLANFGRTFTSAQGQPIRMSGIVLDITERKRAELALQQAMDALQASELKLRQMTDAIPGAVYQYQQFPNGAHRFPFMSAGVLGLYGITAEAVQANADLMWAVLLPDQIDDLAASIQHSATTLEPWEHEYAICVDGQTRWINGRAVPTPQADGSLLWNGMLLDVSARKQAELALQQLNEQLEQRVQQRTQDLQQTNAQLQASEAQFQAFMDNSPTASWITDANARMTYLSQTYYQMFALSTSDVIGKSVFDLYPPEIAQQFLENIQTVVATGQVLETVEIAPRPDGTMGEFLVYKFPITDLSGQGLIGGVGIDITERKRAEAQLQEQEQFLRSIFEGTENPIFVVDVLANGQFQYSGWNAASAKITGLSNTAVLGKSPYEVFGIKLGNSISAHYQRCVEAGCMIRYEEYLAFPLGETWTLTTLNPLKNEAGRIVRIVGNALNITGRKRIEIALRDSEERFRATFEQAAVGMVQANLAGQLVQMNQKFCDIVGYSEAELYLKFFGDITHPDDLASDKAHVSRLLSGAASTFVMEKRYVRSDRTLVWANLSVSLVRDLSGEPQYFIGIIEDISDRKQAELALQESEERFRTLFEATPNPIQGYDQDRRVIFWNRASEELYGYSRTEALGKRVEELIIPEAIQAAVLPLVDAWIAGGTPLPNGELQLRDKQGETIEVYSSHIMLTNMQGGQEMYCIDVDLRERKQAEAALRESEEQYRTIFEAVSDGIFINDLETGQLVAVNTAACQMHGYSREEMLGFGPEHYVHSDSLPVFENYMRVLQSGQPFFGEAKGLRRQETTFDAEVTGTLFWLKGKPHALGLVKDITERKQAEAQLKQQEQLLRTMYEGVEQSICLVDVWTQEGTPSAEFRFVSWNQATERKTGISSAAIVGKTPEELLGESQGKLVRQNYQQCLDAGVSLTYEELVPFQNRDIWWLTTLNPLKDTAGKIYRIVITTFEITDRKQVEAALQESEERLRLALIASDQGLFDLNIKTGEAIVSPTYATMLGYKPAEFHETNAAWLKRVHPDDLDRVRQTYQDYITGRIPEYKLEFRQRMKNGNWKWLLSVGKVVSWDETGQPLRLLGTHTDISERKQAEDALRQLNAELEERVETRTLELRKAVEVAESANRAKSTFLSNMSHELRTPLNAILGFSQLLNRDSHLNSDQQEQVSIINRSGEHLLNLINDILAISKIEAGRVTLTVESFDLQYLLKNLEDLFRLKAQSKGLALSVQREPAAPQYIRTDEGKLRQVLINLLGNAIKFTEQGQVSLQVQVVRRVLAHPTLSLPTEATLPSLTLQFQVKDSGPGITPDEQEALFEPFVQAKAGQKSQEGTGLGLPISRQFVQLMGGDLTVISSVGQGSTFSFEIPVSVVSPDHLSPQPSLQKVIGLAPGQPRYRLLVVEDNRENGLFLTQLLQGVGFEVQTAENGVEAIRQWQQWAPHLIWMDMRMPIMNGYEATCQIRTLEVALAADGLDADGLTMGTGAADGLSAGEVGLRPAVTKILALTASAFEDERAAILAAGCDDFVLKPATETILFDKIAEHIGVRYLYQEQVPSSEVTGGENDINALLVAALQQASSVWIERLQRAARIADEDLILELLEQLPPEQTLLAQALRELVDELRLDQLIELINQVN